MLGFAIETGCEALLPGTAFLARFSFCRCKRRSQNGAASLWNPVAESVAVWRMPEKASFERCDSSAEPALFRTIKATRLSVANYNTTLSSESLETGTGSSNSLRSANESQRTDTPYWPLTVSEQDIIEHRADLFDAVSYLMLSSSQIVMTGQS
jgi:hypothetical protein